MSAPDRDPPQELGVTDPKRERLTVEEHRELALELFDTRNRLGELGGRLSVRYGVTKRSVRLLLRTQVALDTARSELDDQLARDHPEEFCPHVYYPGSREEYARHKVTCDACRRPKVSRM